MSRQTLLKKKKPKTKEDYLKPIEIAMSKALDQGRAGSGAYVSLFGKGYANKIFKEYVKGGMPPKSAARSTLRMLRAMSLDEIKSNLAVD